MKKVVQNINGKHTARTIFRGREIVVKPKQSLKLDLDNEEEKALYHHLLSTFGFIWDITHKMSG